MNTGNQDSDIVKLTEPGKTRKPRPNISETIASLEKKLQQAKALKAQKEAVIKSAQKKIERNEAERRKYLAGAYILSMLKGAELDGLYAEMRAYLKRDVDKQLFAAGPVANV